MAITQGIREHAEAGKSRAILRAIRRIVLPLVASCLVIVSLAGVWAAARPPIQLLLPPGADAIRLANQGVWEWTLTYRAPGAPYAWYFMVERNLAAGGWAPANRRSGGPLLDVTAYVRSISFGFGSWLERVEVQGEPNSARIRIWRGIAIP